jgi:membrane protease YdiL (CAAX protease family)
MIPPARGRREAATGAIVAVVLIALTPGIPTWAGYLLLWAPLVAAVVVAAARRRSARDGDGSTDLIRFGITWMDVLVGAFIGLLLRTVIIVIELFSVGYVTSSSSMFQVDHDVLWFATAIIAPVLLAPIVEELFFRGLVLPAIGTNWIGIVGSAVIFSAVHLVTGFHPITAVSTFIVGVAFGILAVRTGRLGASITAHMVYNGSLIAMSELGGMAAFSG